MMENTTRTPAMRPVRIAYAGMIESAPAVMPTRPARIPLSAIERSGFLRKIQEVNIAPRPPAAAASAVVTKTSETRNGSALRTEPPLKPNQPRNSRKTPIVASGML